MFRPDPAMDVGAYKTYAITQPKTGHTRIGSCEAAGCPNFERGWETRIDENTDIGKRQAAYIRNRSGRKFVEYQELQGITVFLFEAGQQCFTEHHVTDRPQFFLVRDGDFRGNPTGRQRMHTQGNFWVEDFQENQAKLAERLERG